MTRQTKKTVIDEFFEVFEEYSTASSELLEKVEEGKIRYGMYLVYGLPYNYHSNWFLDNRTHGWKKEETKLWEFKYHLVNMQSDLDKIREILADPKGMGAAKE